MPWLGANIFYEDGTYIAPPFFIKNLAGIRILLVGLTTTQIPTATPFENVQGLHFTDPALALESVLLSQKGNYDLCLVLSHLGLEEDKLLAKKITAIIGGHSHISLPTPLKIDNVYIAQVGSSAKFFGKITIPLPEGFPYRENYCPLQTFHRKKRFKPSTIAMPFL